LYCSPTLLCIQCITELYICVQYIFTLFKMDRFGIYSNSIQYSVYRTVTYVYTYELIYLITFRDTVYHRVDRVPGFPSSRSNWPPSPASECCPPLWLKGGGGHTRWGDVGAGGADSDEGTYTLVL
jgi:hypothetical protein